MMPTWAGGLCQPAFCLFGTVRVASKHVANANHVSRGFTLCVWCLSRWFAPILLNPFSSLLSGALHAATGIVPEHRALQPVDLSAKRSCSDP